MFSWLGIGSQGGVSRLPGVFISFFHIIIVRILACARLGVLSSTVVFARIISSPCIVCLL